MLVIVLFLMSNFTFGFTTTWTGGNGILWNDGGNWNNGVPAINDNVVINDPTVPGNNLEISGSEQCNNITFINDGIIYFSTTGTPGSNTLEINGDLLNYSNNADIVGNNNGYIKMVGSNDNIIDGTSSIELYNLEILKSSPTKNVDVNVPLSLWLILRPNMGQLNSNGNLTLRANLTNGTTALTHPFSSDSRINGTVNVQQRVPYSGVYYHYLGSPVSDLDDYLYYTLDAQMADNASSADVYNWTNNYINTSFPDWFVYDETECAGETPAQVITFYQTALSVTLTTAEAECVLTTFGYQSNDNLLTDQLATGTGVISRVDFDTPGDIIDWRGYLNDGFIRVELSKTTCDNGDGLNLVANPYPSPIDWSQLYGLNGSEVEAFAYIWTPDAGATTAFGVSSGDGYFSVLDATYGTSIIPSPNWTNESGVAEDSIGIGQGFLVRALNDNSRLDFENTCRNISTSNHILRESQAKEALQLILQSPSGKDYTNIYLSNNASDVYDNNEDALKMLNPKVNIATVIENKKLMINRLSKQNEEIEVPLIMSNKIGETATLSIGSNAFESSEYMAIFEDKKLKTQQIIATNFKYNYVVQTAEEDDRFIVKFVKGNATVNQSINGANNIYMANQQLNIFSSDFNNASVYIADASGRIVKQENVVFSNSKSILDLNALCNGIYIVNVQGASGSFNQKVFINK
jgi:trimeric autotransporter adhesin